MKPGPLRMDTSLKRQATSCDILSRGTMPQIIKTQATSHKRHNPWRKAQASSHKQQALLFSFPHKVLEGYKSHLKLGYKYC